MRLGTRWSVGAPPPAGLPDALLAAIATAEAALPDESTARWTLSWLEGRPSAELDDGPLLELTASGEVVESAD